MVWKQSKGVLTTQRKRAKVAAFMAVFLLSITSLALVLVPFIKQASATTANVDHIVFTTSEQSVEQNVVSGQINIQAQNSSNASEQLDTSNNQLQLTPSSVTGQFSENGTSGWTTPGTEADFTFNNGWAQHHFYYKDSTQGSYSISAVLSADNGAQTWSASQDITIDPVAASFTPPLAASQTSETVTPSSLSFGSWYYYDDNTDTPSTSSSSAHQITSNPVSTSGDMGAIQLDGGNGSRNNIASLQYTGTKLSDIAKIGFSTYQPSSNSGGVSNSPFLNFDVDFGTGLGGYQGRLVYVPEANTPQPAQDSWGNYEAVASNGKWIWSHFASNDNNKWPDNNTSQYRTWNDIVAAFPDAKVAGQLLVRAGEPYSYDFTGYVDHIYLATNAQNVNYNFEPEIPDTSSFVFTGSPKYVRANSNDESARILVSNQTTDARFYVDGSTTPISGSLVGPSTGTTEWWKLKTPLAAGEHNITAQVKINGSWYDVSGSGIAYSLDSPWAEYVIPQSNQYFRPNDKVVRIKADDEFDQFKNMKVTIDGVPHNIARADCSDKGNYVLCDLQNLNLPQGTYKASTTTYTKANNRVDNLLSPEFTIDNIRPTLTNLQITNPHSVYSDSVSVSAYATDNNGIKNVTFYITAPRASDGLCDGNGAHLATALGAHDSGNTYGAYIDTSSLNGDYCINAIAEDVAANHSTPILHIKANFDNTAPNNPTLISPANNAVIKGASLTQSWSDSSSDVDHYIYESYNNSSATSLRYHTTYSATSKTATNVGETTYWWRVKAVDEAGNESGWSPLWKVTVDNTAPDVSITSPSEGDVIRGAITIKGNITDSNPDHYYLVIKNASGHIVGGPHTVNAANVADYNWNTASVSDGVYTIDLKARDAAGNKDSGSVVIKTVTVDNTSPTEPTANPPAGDYTGTQQVELASTDALSGLDKIYYTTDGSTPSSSSTEYTGPITVSHDETIKAIAYDKAGNSSTVLIATYGIAPVIDSEQAVTPTTSSVMVTWTTDEPATSRVIYDTVSHSSLGSIPNYGYAHSTTEDSAKVTNHSVTVTGLTPGTTYYFRAVSHGSPETVSSQFSASTKSNSSTKSSNSSGGSISNFSIVNGIGNNLATVFGVGINGGATTSAAANNGNNQAVLGAQTNKDNNKKSDFSNSKVLGDSATIKNSGKCSKFLGICWYYWVPSVIVVAGIVYYFFRRRNHAEA